MSRLKNAIIAGLVLLIVAAGGFLSWLPTQYVVPIMMYHHVDYAGEPQPNWVSPERFERHMAYLKKHGFKVLSLDELVETAGGQKPFSGKRVVITFDDGNEDNYIYAFNILKKYGFPAIIFVPSDFVNTPGYLNWEQMKEMINGGVAIGSHTRRHAYLPDLSAVEQWDEISGSKRMLEQHLGVPVEYLAYPVGGFSEAIKRFVKDAGYKGAATTNRGHDRFNKDVFELNRIRFSDKDNRNDYLWMKLSGYYNLFRKAKDAY